MIYRRKKENLLEKIYNLPITILIIIFTVIFSLIGFISWAVNEESLAYFALKPENILQGKYLWTLITHIFSHGGLLHLFVNMFVLFSLGGLCERIIGRKRFFWFFLISGILAGILSVFLSGYFGYGILEKVFGAPNVYMVGASGALFAVAGLLMMLLPKLRFSIIFLPFFSLPAYIMVPLVLFLTWIVSILAGFPIGNVAHFGGFLVGLVYGYYLRSRYRKKIMLLERFFR